MAVMSKFKMTYKQNTSGFFRSFRKVINKKPIIRDKIRVHNSIKQTVARSENISMTELWGDRKDVRE